MIHKESPNARKRTGDGLLRLSVAVLLLIACELNGWMALMLVILAAGIGFGLVAGAAFDVPPGALAPVTRPKDCVTRRAA